MSNEISTRSTLQGKLMYYAHEVDEVIGRMTTLWIEGLYFKQPAIIPFKHDRCSKQLETAVIDYCSNMGIRASYNREQKAFRLTMPNFNRLRLTTKAAELISERKEIIQRKHRRASTEDPTGLPW